MCAAFSKAQDFLLKPQPWETIDYWCKNPRSESSIINRVPSCRPEEGARFVAGEVWVCSHRRGSAEGKSCHWKFGVCPSSFILLQHQPGHSKEEPPGQSSPLNLLSRRTNKSHLGCTGHLHSSYEGF